MFRFNPVAGIHYKETSISAVFNSFWLSFNPVAGIHYKETTNPFVFAEGMDSFNPVAGIHYKETSDPDQSYVEIRLFQSRCRDSL